MTQAWDTIVIVKADHAPGSGDEVWSGEVSSPDKVSLAWKSSNRLQITLPTDSVTYKKTTHTSVVLEFLEFNDHAVR